MDKVRPQYRSNIEDGDWVVVMKDNGQSESVQAKKGSRAFVGGAMCVTEDLIGQPYGSYFDAVQVSLEERDSILENYTLAYKLGEGWEQKREEKMLEALKKEQNTDVNASGPPKRKRRKKARDEEESESEEEEEEGSKQPLSTMVCKLVKSSQVGASIKNNTEELQAKRVELLEQLCQVEQDLNMESSIKGAFEANKRLQRNNQFLNNNNNSQKMSNKQVRALRDSGISAGEIVEELIKNSETFASKNENTQEKFKERKLMKYSKRYRVLRANAETLGRTLWSRLYMKSAKTGNFRPEDVVPQMLAYGNVQCGSRVLILETMYGLLTGAVLERMGDQGKIYAGRFGSTISPSNMIPYFNFSEKQRQMIRSVGIDELADPKEDGDTLYENIKTKVGLICKQIDLLEHEKPSSDSRAKEIQKEIAIYKKSKVCLERRIVERAEETRKRIDDIAFLRQHGADCLLIASKYDPASVLKAAFQFLAPGRPFVVWSESVELLQEARHAVGGETVKVKITETFLREHQVLYNRTHPLMNMSTHGGAFLQGFKALKRGERSMKNNAEEI